MPSRARSSLPAFNRLEMRRTMKPQKLVTLTLRPPMDMSPDQLQPTISGHCPWGRVPRRHLQPAVGAGRPQNRGSDGATRTGDRPSRAPERSAIEKENRLGRTAKSQTRPIEPRAIAHADVTPFHRYLAGFPRYGSAVDCGQKSDEDANEVRETSQPPSYVG